MAEVVCDTSPLQYLHQLRLIHLLPSLARSIVVPPAVEEEILAGQAQGIDLPDLKTLAWLSVRHPVSRPAVPLVRDLGPGETEVLMLGLEVPGSVLILDDALARQVAESLEIPFTCCLRWRLTSLVNQEPTQAIRWKLAKHSLDRGAE